MGGGPSGFRPACLAQIVVLMGIWHKFKNPSDEYPWDYARVLWVGLFIARAFAS